MSQWQPIETAPKDGTRIILALYRKGRCVWVTEDGWDDDHGQWADDGSMTPSHWMPLPEPPHQQD